MHSRSYEEGPRAVGPQLPQDFIKHAEECERLAADVTNASARDTLLYVASRWRALAAADERDGTLPQSESSGDNTSG